VPTNTLPRKSQSSRIFCLSMLVPCALPFVTPAEAQRSLSREDPKVLLLEVRKKVRETVGRLPNYLCTETVDRSTFQPESPIHSCDDLASGKKKSDWRLRKRTSDRVRLDVAVSPTGEMYSWVGEDRFENRRLADFVLEGAISTGTFASFLNNIFVTNAATFTYKGGVTADAHRFVEFGFRVPAEKSTYHIGRRSHHHDIVGYEGTFLVDPSTFDLVRLTIRPNQIPAEFEACQSIMTLDYDNVRLNNSEFLIPKQARWHIITLDGSESDNITVFSSCHEFLSESTIRFGTPPETTGAVSPKRAKKGLRLPSGLSFSFVLTDPIDTATAAAGDPFKARLKSAIGKKRNVILVPKGAAISGRIVRIERVYGLVSQSLVLALKLETIEANGVPEPFYARLESVVKMGHAGPVEKENLGSFDKKFDPAFDPKDPAVGIVQFDDVAGDYVINRGLEIEGVTAAPK
jgi:hypothetical protein